MAIDTAVVSFLFLCATKVTLLQYISYKNKRKQRECVRALAKAIGLPSGETDWMLCGPVVDLYLHPVKSCRGWSLTQARCTSFGLEDIDTGVVDRSFVVLSMETKKPVTLPDEPTMVLVSVEVVGVDLQFTAPTMDPLLVRLSTCTSSKSATIVDFKIWGEDTKGIDCGPDAAQWWCKYLCRNDLCLVAANSELSVRKLEQSKWKDYCRDTINEDDQVQFADWSPFMITTSTAVDDLNSRLNIPISVRNFRPNIVVADAPAFSEDTWNYIVVGSFTLFRNVKPCTRCKLTTVNVETGTVLDDEQPLKTLNTYRKDETFDKYSPIFGVNLVLRHPGDIHIGDLVWALKKTELVQ